MTAITFLDGEWVEGNPLILGPMTHATWMASVVFDGARAFAGVAPDLDLHCTRVVKSACALGRIEWSRVSQSVARFAASSKAITTRIERAFFMLGPLPLGWCTFPDP